MTSNIQKNAFSLENTGFSNMQDLLNNGLVKAFYVTDDSKIMESSKNNGYLLNYEKPGFGYEKEFLPNYFFAIGHIEKLIAKETINKINLQNYIILRAGACFEDEKYKNNNDLLSKNKDFEKILKKNISLGGLKSDKYLQKLKLSSKNDKIIIDFGKGYKGVISYDDLSDGLQSNIYPANTSSVYYNTVKNNMERILENAEKISSLKNLLEERKPVSFVCSAIYEKLRKDEAKNDFKTLFDESKKVYENMLNEFSGKNHSCNNQEFMKTTYDYLKAFYVTRRDYHIISHQSDGFGHEPKELVPNLFFIMEQIGDWIFEESINDMSSENYYFIWDRWTRDSDGHDFLSEEMREEIISDVKTNAGINSLEKCVLSSRGNKIYVDLGKGYNGLLSYKEDKWKTSMRNGYPDTFYQKAVLQNFKKICNKVNENSEEIISSMKDNKTLNFISIGVFDRYIGKETAMNHNETLLEKLKNVYGEDLYDKSSLFHSEKNEEFIKSLDSSNE